VLTGTFAGGTAGTGGVPVQLTTLFATVAGILGGLMAFLKPAEHEERHKRSGDSWSILRDQFTNLRCLKADSREISEKELQEGYDLLLKNKEGVTKEAPITPTWAYKRALKEMRQDPTHPDSLPKPSASKASQRAQA